MLILTDCSFNFDEDSYDVTSENNVSVMSPKFTSSMQDYVIGNLKVVAPEKSQQKHADDVKVSPAKSEPISNPDVATFSPSKPEFSCYDVTSKTDLVPTSSLLEFEPYNGGESKQVDSCSELMTSSQDSGVCSKSSNDVMSFVDQKLAAESFRRSEAPKRHSNVVKPEVPAKPRNLFAKHQSKAVTSPNDDDLQRNSFRDKLEKMMKRQSGSMTSSNHPPLSRRNSGELRRNGSLTSSSGDVSTVPTSERIRQRLQSMPSTSSSGSSKEASAENLQEKLGQLLLEEGSGDGCRLYDHQSRTKPLAPKPLPVVAKQQRAMPDDWRWRVLEHLRQKNVVPPLPQRNCDVMRAKTPAMTTLSASALPPMNSMTSLRPKSAMNHANMTSSAFTRSANDVTTIPQNVKVCYFYVKIVVKLFLVITLRRLLIK